MTDFFLNTVSAYEVGTLRQLPGSPRPSLGISPSLNSVAVLPNLGPRASFTAEPRGDVASFDANASSDEDGRIARYDWNFGDGTTLLDGGPRPSHTYRQPGTYRVTLVVTDNEGCSTSLLFTGFTPVCVGSAAARTTQQIQVAGRT